MSGKGSVQRPPSVPRAEYDRRWSDTFASVTRAERLAGGLKKLGVPLEHWPLLLCSAGEAQDEMESSQIGNRILRHHPASACAGQYCSIHNPSDHPMRDFPLHWRDDRGLMERVCPHGVGHPDPDHIEHVRRTRGDDVAWAEGIHGCCGECHG